MEALPSTTSKNLPKSSLTSTDKIAAAIARFGPDYRDLVFSRYQTPMPLSQAVQQHAPTFYDITAFFSKEATLFWLRFHIAETFAFIGIYDTASKRQIQQTADLILSHEIYGQLTLAEFLTFLARFKRGDYGKIYQSSRPNPQEFLLCLKPYWEDLSQERGRHEQQLQLEKIRSDRLAAASVTPEQLEHIEQIKRKLTEKLAI